MAIEKILIPVDFSGDLIPVFKYLQHVSEGKNLEVTLLHIVEFPVVPGNYMTPMDYLGEFYQKHIEAHQKQLEELSEKDWFTNCRVNFELIADPGVDISDRVAEYADGGDFQLVILFSRHRKGLETLFPGSDLMRIIRKCEVPMLLLSPGEKDNLNIKRIAFATDFSEESADMFKDLKEIAQFMRAEIQAFKVTTSHEFQDSRAFNKLRVEFLNKIGAAELPPIQNQNAWTLESGIMHFAEDHLMDAIALATHGRSGISRLFNRSVTENVIRDTTQPLVILNMND